MAKQSAQAQQAGGTFRPGQRVLVLGVLDENGRPAPCILESWHPNPYATGKGTGEWSYRREDGARGAGQQPSENIAPWEGDLT